MNAEPSRLSRHVHRARRTFRATVVFLLAYLLLAYLLIPTWWRFHGKRSSAADLPTITRTGDGAPGDPVNVGLVGTRGEVLQALLDAGWRPADRTTFRNSVRICRCSLTGEEYCEAPMSKLYLWGREQDLAFQAQAGKGPATRHHVRFWRSDVWSEDSRPLWVGAATFDRSVGLNRRNLQPTHHIAADVDRERDQLIADLDRTGQLARVFRVRGVGPTENGRNGGWDVYRTDGDRVVGVLTEKSDALALGSAP